MKITLLIPTALRSFTGGSAETEFELAEGSTVKDVLSALTEKFAAIKTHIFSGEELRPFINIFLGETNIKESGGLSTPLKDGGELLLVPAIAGGIAGGRDV